MNQDSELLREGMEQQEESAFSFQAIFSMLVLNWQYFLLSLFICVCGALIYLRYATPVYQMSVKMLIKEDNSSRTRRSANMLNNMQELGFLSNSAGIENEVEILQSRVLARDAVKNLKLYTEYRSAGRLKKSLIYQSQPVNVDLDPQGLNAMDKDMLYGMKSISMSITMKDGKYQVNGKTLYQGKVSKQFNKTLPKLPAAFKTEYGVLTFTHNEKAEAATMTESDEYLVTICPPMFTAMQYAASLSVEPSTKMSSIAVLSLKDPHPLRGMDFLNQLAVCYNQQANADKNEIAIRTEEFINGRLEKIDAELGSTENALQSYKERHAVTQLQVDATQSLQMSNQYETKLAEANAQIHLLDYLREYIDKPENQYKTIPSNVGMTDAASTMLISNYNKTVQDRNRLMKAASEQAPQVQTMTATLDDLQTSIRQALLQARRSADIQRQSIQNQYNKYQSRIGNTPEQERVLTQIGRQQEVKSGLYLLLLQKREENSISLAATANNGKLIDEPQFNGKVSPKSSIILLVAIIIGLGIPFVIFYILQLLRFRIEGHDDVARLTPLPIVADIPVASDSVKSAAGIVVQADKNNQIDEIFRSLRTNVQFMMKEGEQTILFTSSISGEGKTFIAANLAMSFSLLGKKVVLCGLDIRKPALGRLFGIKDRQKGVSTLLNKNTITAEDVYQQIANSGVNENLDLLMAGPTPPNPTELLARDNLRIVLDHLKERYDYVILDTAPVGLVADTMQIARYANVCCYLCRADYTPKTNIELLNSLSESGKLPNLCVILNGVDMSKKKYGYYYGYGKYGKYGRYGYGRYGRYGYSNYGNYGNYGIYANSHYGNKNDDSIKK
ncbi:MAG: polysaccharide biosynthesis tyrosine autokinase [Prevotella sp.]|nr:polysaccharide biosynthesis tyrosine autokinase [Prevotella sp.]